MYSQKFYCIVLWCVKHFLGYNNYNYFNYFWLYHKKARDSCNTLSLLTIPVTAPLVFECFLTVHVT